MSGDQQFVVLIVGQAVTALASILAFLKAQSTAKQLSATDMKVEAVHVATNSMKDALVKATGEAEHAKGVTEGTMAERLNPQSPAGT